MLLPDYSLTRLNLTLHHGELLTNQWKCHWKNLECMLSSKGKDREYRIDLFKVHKDQI
jgi:hypothetical protein